ncbi:MAG: thiol-disulfide oxidoreductase DCC family protein [Pseudomonadales bacterium]
MNDALEGATDTPEVRVLYNGSCPICATEIHHYQRYTEDAGLPVAYDDLMTEAVASWSVEEDTAAKALRVRQGDRVYVGVDAFLVLWRAMPRYRLLARLVALPGIYHAACVVYDWVLAPALFWLHKRRQRRS